MLIKIPEEETREEADELASKLRTALSA